MIREEITSSNIDDYIRQEKKRTMILAKNKSFIIKRKRFFWNRKHWKILKEFVMVTKSSLYCDNGIKLKSGDMFLGVKHFRKL